METLCIIGVPRERGTFFCSLEEGESLDRETLGPYAVFLSESVLTNGKETDWEIVAASVDSVKELSPTAVVAVIRSSVRSITGTYSDFLHVVFFQQDPATNMLEWKHLSSFNSEQAKPWFPRRWTARLCHLAMEVRFTVRSQTAIQLSLELSWSFKNAGVNNVLCPRRSIIGTCLVDVTRLATKLKEGVQEESQTVFDANIVLDE